MVPLYDDDFVLWLQRQAQLLRERRFDDLDIVNLVEEIESMAGDQKMRVREEMERALVGMVLLSTMPHAGQSTEWHSELIEAQVQIEARLDLSPSLQKRLQVILDKAWLRARTTASTRLRHFGHGTWDAPNQCPYSLEKVIGQHTLYSTRCCHSL